MLQLVIANLFHAIITSFDNKFNSKAVPFMILNGTAETDRFSI